MIDLDTQALRIVAVALEQEAEHGPGEGAAFLRRLARMADAKNAAERAAGAEAAEPPEVRVSPPNVSGDDLGWTEFTETEERVIAGCETFTAEFKVPESWPPMVGKWVLKVRDA